MDIEDKETAEIRREHNRRIRENPIFQKAQKTATDLMQLAFVWIDSAIEESEGYKVRWAREKAYIELDRISRNQPYYFLEYFKQTAEELGADKPLEEMTTEEKLEVITSMFNNEATQAGY